MCVCLDVRVCVNVGVRMFVDVSVKMGEDKDCHCPGISAISGAFSWISPLLSLAVLVNCLDYCMAPYFRARILWHFHPLYT